MASETKKWNTIVKVAVCLSVTVWLLGCSIGYMLTGYRPSPPPTPAERERRTKELEEEKKPHIAVSYFASTFGTDTNGEEVVYVLKRVTWGINLKDESHWFLCSVNPNGGARREICSIENRYDGRNLPWLPPGYMEINSEANLGIVGSGEYMLVFRLSGMNIRYFDCLAWNEEGRPWRFSNPTFSPDGQWIAFVEERCPKGPGGACYYRLVKCRLDGTGYKVLTEFTNYENDVQPAWSPTDGLIAYVHSYWSNVGNGELRVMDVDGNIQWFVGDRSSRFEHPHWSHDGKLLLLSGEVVVETTSKKAVEKLNPPLPKLARWGKSGYVVPRGDGVDFIELDGKTSYRLLQNISRSAQRADMSKEKFRW